ncbi:MAG TPA: AAA family ATPase [Mycobacteriales bacterium]
MIIWLNGTFGVGKTTTAAALNEQLPGWRLFDPETVGFMLRGALADHPVSDFQHWPPWRRLVVDTALALADYTGDDLIVSQTILIEDYADEIFGGLRAAGQDILHVLLDATDPALRRRIESSAEARGWRLDHLERYASSRASLRARADLIVDTDSRTPDAVAAEIGPVVQGVRSA